MFNDEILYPDSDEREPSAAELDEIDEEDEEDEEEVY